MGDWTERFKKTFTSMEEVMAASLREHLQGYLDSVPGVSIALVVGRDGFVIEAAHKGMGIDVEAIGAVVSTGMGSSEGIGKELKIGEMYQSMMEYKDGIIVMSAVGADAIFVIVATPDANIGNIRYQLKKRLPDIAKAI